MTKFHDTKKTINELESSNKLAWTRFNKIKKQLKEKEQYIMNLEDKYRNNLAFLYLIFTASSFYTLYYNTANFC